MSIAYLNSKITERTTLAAAAESLYDKCATDGTNPTAEQRSQLDGWKSRVRELDAEIAELRAAVDANANMERTVAHIADLDESRERRAAQDRDERRPETRMTTGEAFVNSDAFKSFPGYGTSGRVEFEGFLETRAAITTADLDIPPYRWDGPRGEWVVTPLLDVIGRERVSTGTVEYITWDESPVAGGPIAEGELKPEATFVPTTTPISLATYAHWKAVTRQALEDYPRIRSIIETKLRTGLGKKLESVAAGVINAGTWETVTDPDALNGIRQGIGLVQANGFNPNAVLINPADYASLDIAAAGQAGNGPVQFGAFWGLRPVPSPDIPEGTAYVGDFLQAVTWFDRNTTAVFMTDSHADYAIRNLLLILAEQRAAFAVTDLAAAAKVVVGTPAAAAATTTSK